MKTATVVIPTHDRRGLLEQAIETVREQTYDSIELIVIDDGSTDGTRSYLESLDYENFRPVYHDDNLGQSIARNAGIDEATGEYVVFLDSDDVLYPHAVETLVGALEEQTQNCVGAFASTKLINRRGRVKKRNVPSGSMTEPTLENVRKIGGLSCTAFRLEALNEVGGFDESLPRRVDLDLYLRLLNEHELYGVDEFCCERRIHDEGLSGDDEKVNKSYRKLAEKHGFDTVNHRHRDEGVYYR